MDEKPEPMKMFGDPQYLYCMHCGKQVSTGFYPVPTDTPDKGVIVRAAVLCPECFQETE